MGTTSRISHSNRAICLDRNNAWGRIRIAKTCANLDVSGFCIGTDSLVIYPDLDEIENA